MELSVEQLALIATWASVDDTFDSEESFRQLQNELSGLSNCTWRVFENGGLSNYFAFLIWESKELMHSATQTYRDLQALAVYLSLYAPVGVIGWTTSSFGTTFSSIKYLDVEDVIDASQASTDLESHIISIVQKHGYQLLSPECVTQTLPADIQIYEYCLCAEPWDKYFHALFANTD